MKLRFAVAAAMAALATTAALLVGVGPAAADGSVRVFLTKFGTIEMNITHEGHLQTNLRVISGENRIRSDSWVEILYRDGDIANVKFTEVVARANGSYVYTNPINRPNVDRVQFHIGIGPAGDIVGRDWEYVL